jgi:hypothetical protein
MTKDITRDFGFLRSSDDFVMKNATGWLFTGKRMHMALTKTSSEPFVTSHTPSGATPSTVRQEANVWVLPTARIMEILRGSPIDGSRGTRAGARRAR